MSSRDRLHLYHETKYSADAIAPSDQIVKNNSFPSNRFEACLKYFSIRFRGGDILELGAGSGVVARSLIANGVEFSTYTLSEVSPSRLKGLLQSFADPRMRVVKVDAESLPDDVQYDAVIMIALIAQLVDPIATMQQVRKLLKPGGFVFIETPNVAKITRRAKLLLGRFPAIASRNEGLTTYEGDPVTLLDEGHLHYFTFRSLSLMLVDRCGFSKVEKLGYFIGPGGKCIFGQTVGNFLVRLWPKLFSEIVLVAHA